jgi:hypothetical protein
VETRESRGNGWAVGVAELVVGEGLADRHEFITRNQDSDTNTTVYKRRSGTKAGEGGGHWPGDLGAGSNHQRARCKILSPPADMNAWGQGPKGSFGEVDFARTFGYILSTHDGIGAARDGGAGEDFRDCIGHELGRWLTDAGLAGDAKRSRRSTFDAQGVAVHGAHVCRGTGAVGDDVLSEDPSKSAVNWKRFRREGGDLVGHRGDGARG